MSITEHTRRESYERVDKETIYKHILSILKSGKAMTAREIAVCMYEKYLVPFPVRQAAAPRLTELEYRGLVKVVGKTFDEITRRNVAVYKLVEK